MPKRTVRIAPEDWFGQPAKRLETLRTVRKEVRAAMGDEPYVVTIKVGRTTVATITGSGSKPYYRR